MEREQRLRGLVATLSTCDLRNSLPLGNSIQYDAVSCFYTTEQASESKDQWFTVFSNLSTLVRTGGRLITCSVGPTDHYVVYDTMGHPHRYEIPVLNPNDFICALATNGFHVEENTVKYEPLTGQESEGVVGVILASAVKL